MLVEIGQDPDAMCIGRAQYLRLHARGSPKHLQDIRGKNSQKGGFLTSEDGGGAVRFFLSRRCYISSNSIRTVRTQIVPPGEH